MMARQLWKRDTDDVFRKDIPKTFDPSLTIQTVDGREAKIYETLIREGDSPVGKLQHL